VPGEQHTLGLFMVAEFFLRDGWSVSAGPPLTESDLLHTVQDNWFDVIGLSVGFTDRLGALRRQVARVKRASRNPDLLILVGGTAFGEDPGLAGRLGADSWAADGRQAPGIARAMLQWRQQGQPRGLAASGGEGSDR
jgi:methanogenic corrinoid protein MtbC1